MSAIASQITSLTIVYSIVPSGADQRKYQSSASLTFVREIHWWPVNSPHKWPETRKMFPFDDITMETSSWQISWCLDARAIGQRLEISQILVLRSFTAWWKQKQMMMLDTVVSWRRHGTLSILLALCEGNRCRRITLTKGQVYGTLNLFLLMTWTSCRKQRAVVCGLRNRDAHHINLFHNQWGLYYLWDVDKRTIQILFEQIHSYV